jgi:tripartite-type tricarboxylate transporter receptor subunit TctC
MNAYRICVKSTALMVAAGMLVACGVSTAGAAERGRIDNYPNHPIRLVVPAPSGGSVDVMARLLARQLETQLGQTIVVDNRGGANGIIGFDIVSKAPADGYTLVSTASAFAINPAIYRKLPYDTEKDFVPIANFANGPGYLLVVHPSVPATTLRELVTLAREKPLRYGTAGIGNGQHLVAELLNMTAGIQLQHVPYKGAAPAFNAVLSGEVHVHFAAVITALAQVKAGRLRALGFTGVTRLGVLPEVPTFSESAYPGFVYQTGWHAWFAPARTPEAIVERLHVEIRRALNAPQLRESFLAAGSEPIGDTRAEFAKILHADLKRYAEIARAAKIEPQ